MKKQHIRVLIAAAVLLVAVLFARTPKEDKVLVGDVFKEEVNTVEGLSMQVLPQTADAEGVQATLQNDTGSNYHTCGALYDLQLNVKDQWYHLERHEGASGAEGVYGVQEPNRHRITEALELPAGLSGTAMYLWGADFGVLQPGHYRIVEQLISPDFPEKSFYLAAEFHLE